MRTIHYHRRSIAMVLRMMISISPSRNELVGVVGKVKNVVRKTRRTENLQPATRTLSRAATVESTEPHLIAIVARMVATLEPTRAINESDATERAIRAAVALR
uniref:Uncharacterized protein n=1 Tax=Anopheles funestus TaxID=62324 RepID=A0A182R4S8_ANOFN